MPATTFGLEEIDARLRSLSRRLNSLAIQRAFFVNGSAVVFASAALVVLALHTSPSSFGLGLALALGGVAASALGAALRLRRAWMSPAAAARFADRQAGLEDRLATLVAYRDAREPPPLRAILLAQTVALAARWDPRLLVPRRVPRNWILFALSLVVLLFTVFIERPPPAPQATSPTGRVERSPQSNAARRDPAPATAAPAHDDALAPAHSGGNPLSAGAAVDAPPDAANLIAAGPGTTGAHSSSSAQIAARQPLPPAQLLQDMIRQALGARALSQPRNLSSPAHKPEREGATASETRDGKGNKPGERDQRGEGKQIARKKEERAPEPQQAGAPRPEGEWSGRNSGGSRAGAAGATAGGLFAGGKSDAARAGASKGFALTLTRLSSMVETQMEPQAKEPPPPQPRPGHPRARGAPASHAPPGDDATRDAALHRSEVGPEYERILREIFSAER